MKEFVTSHTLSPMPVLPRTRKNKPQERSIVTKAAILDAAQAVFAELGFEKAQLDEVAARAGYSRGVIYVHFESKEELFLSLMEQRVHAKFRAVCKKIAEEPELSKRLGIFRRWIATQVADPSWGTLTLEFKLYAVRRPESRERLWQLYKLVFEDPDGDFVELLFGKGLSKAKRTAIDRRLALLGGALSGFVLESHFRPDLLPTNHVSQLAEELFDALMRT